MPLTCNQQLPIIFNSQFSIVMLSLLPSFILIILYFIAEEFFGAKIGLIAVIVLGIGEFTYSWIKEKRVNKMTLANTLFFIALGVITVLLEGTSFERIQQTIVEPAMCVLLGIFAFTKADMTKTLPEAYRKSMQITAAHQQAMRRMLKLLFYLLVIHTAVAFASAFLCNDEVHSFIEGPLLYILIALFFLTFFVKNRLLAKAARDDEWVPVVNEKGEVVGKATRRSVHSGSMLLHPVVHLHIMNKQGDIYLQKRSMKKDLLPGKWDTAVGGHVGFGEKIEDALKRETQEELGITKFKARFLGSYVWESSRERELVFSFLCTAHDAIDIHNEEVDEGRFWSHKEIEAPANASTFTPNFLHEYQRLLRR